MAEERITIIPPQFTRGDGTRLIEAVEKQTRFEAEYDVNGNVIFFGEAAPGAFTSAPVWRIAKFVWDVNNNPLRRLWADGDTEFNNIWDDRASLNYS